LFRKRKCFKTLDILFAVQNKQNLGLFTAHISMKKSSKINQIKAAFLDLTLTKNLAPAGFTSRSNQLKSKRNAYVKSHVNALFTINNQHKLYVFMARSKMSSAGEQKRIRAKENLIKSLAFGRPRETDKLESKCAYRIQTKLNNWNCMSSAWTALQCDPIGSERSETIRSDPIRYDPSRFDVIRKAGLSSRMCN